MNKTQRLYGKDVDPSRWKTMGYLEVLEDKITLASERIRMLNLVDMQKRPQYNITECMAAIKWCRDMIQETEDARN